MTLLAQYDRARCALAEATRVDQVLAIRDELEHVKLYAKQIRDRALMADAAAFQMRAERRLGVLLAAAREAGQLIDKGRRRKDDAESVATLAEIGVDKKLSMTAQRAAALEEAAFETLVDGVREKMASGRAIVVDPIDAAAKVADIDRRRAEHAARAEKGGTADDLAALARSGFRAATIYMDPPWHFETRSAAGEGRSANTHYTTGLIDRIMADLAPVKEIAADNSVLLSWIVDWCPHLALALIEALGFEHKTTAFTWAKTEGDGWHMGQGYWTRANPEDCWLATRGNPKRLHADVRQLIVAPIMEHSRKPDEAYDRIERLVEGPYLELYARRPRKGWVSWGNELEFTGEAA
jgi:N6-adenosine-specific RNA methylase IME4